jgi:TPR repeat protein
MRSFFSALVIIVPLLFQTSLSFAATEITGTVAAKRGDSVQVTFEPHEAAGPAVGDAVSFSKEIPGTGGIRAKAGEGTVTEVDGTTVWVKTIDNRPNLKMDAVIQATGTANLYPVLKKKYDAFKENHDVKILRDLENHALNGNADAQNMVGLIYVYGYGGINRDTTKGMEWYRKATEQGHARAQFHFGVLYDFGQGVERNYTEAAKWYLKAAKQGDADAQNNLGFLYREGQGVEQNRAKAVKWFRKSAEQGSPRAQYQLGFHYEKGLGIHQDVAEAVKWYRKSAEQGYEYAQYNLGRLYESGGDGFSKDINEAINLYQKAAAQKNEDARKALKRLGR